MKTLKRVLAIVMALTLCTASFALCVGAAEDAVGTKYTLNFTDLGNENDPYTFYASSTKTLAGLTELTFGSGNSNWGHPVTGYGPEGDTVKYFGEGIAAGELSIFGSQSDWKVLAFTAPQGGEYSYSFSAKVWDNVGSMFIDVYRANQPDPVNSIVPQGTPAKYEGTVKLAKSEKLYFVFYAAPNVDNFFQLDGTIDVTYTKAQTGVATKDVYYKLGDLSDLEEEYFEFGYIKTEAMANSANNDAVIAAENIASMVALNKTFERKLPLYNGWKGMMLLPESKDTSGLTADDLIMGKSIETYGNAFFIRSEPTRVGVIKFVIPEDGKWSYKVVANDNAPASFGVQMDVSINGTDWWKGAALPGTAYSTYEGGIYSCDAKQFSKGDTVYFFFRMAQEVSTDTLVSSFEMIQHDVPLENEKTSDNNSLITVAALVVAASTAIVVIKKRHH